MFEYGKDIPLEDVAVSMAAKQGSPEEKAEVEGTVFIFDHSKEIPMVGIK